MKKLTLLTLIIISVITTGIIPKAHAGSIDPNAEIKAEFKDDVPKSYDQVISEVRIATESNSTTNNHTDDIGISPATFSLIESDTDMVRVVYTGQAKLFGFIPVPVAIEVAITADGIARVAMPWYRFVLSYEDTKDLELVLSSMIQAKTKLPSPTGILSENDQAIIMMLLQDILPFHFIQ